MDSEYYEMGFMVPCPRISPRAGVPLKECQQCEYHGRVERVRAASGGKPELFNVLCSMPTRIQLAPMLTKDPALADRIGDGFGVDGEVVDCTVQKPASLESGEGGK